MSALLRLKLLDPDGRISLTNLALYVVLGLVSYCTLRSGSVDATALGALLTALAAYRGKSWQVDKRDAHTADRDADKLKAENDTLRKELDRAVRHAAQPGRNATLPAGLAR